MERMYIITGASGHLGSTILRQLKGQPCQVRGLILPSEERQDIENITYVKGDVRDPESLKPLFEGCEEKETYVIHTAGIVDISGQETPVMRDVNVNGTKNILALCRQFPVKRLVHVSSVHAIPEKDSLSVLREVSYFSPDLVEGGYAKTKAEATQAVLDAVSDGLDAVVVHPSGIIGPYDAAGNHLVQLVKDYISGKLPACVRGGYDFVDVRDVADGCLKAALYGRRGECYILSNRHYEIKDVLQMVRQIVHGRKLPVLPVWMAKMAAPFMGWVAKKKNRRPLFTKYSLYTLSSNDRFDHVKATCELHYRPRDLYQTIYDTVMWLKKKKATA